MSVFQCADGAFSEPAKKRAKKPAKKPAKKTKE